MPEERRWTIRPEDSTWGDFGPDDQLGRLNLLTPEKVLQAVREVKTGRTFCLSLPLDYPGGTALNPRRKPPRIEPTLRGDKPNMVYPLSRDNPHLLDVICDDTVQMTLQYSTQWDSLAHMGQWFDSSGTGKPEMLFYNGFRAGEEIVGPLDYRVEGAPPTGRASGASKLGIENMAAAGVQGRGVMIDLKRHFGTKRVAVGYRELMEVMEAQQVVVESGDMVCFRTGTDEALLDMAGDPDLSLLEGRFAAFDGRDEKLRRWIVDSNVVALIADNAAVEMLPAAPSASERYPSHPLHDLCLFRLGVYLGELWHLSELADWLHANGRSRFLLTAPPLRLPGAVGSPVTPIASV
ncbi:cyclase family protein [Trinickia terrae]|uniref:Cyclase family protein n=1 Tax=Trinickia terrae TaxID=2571161 RepID=A0A4U1HXE0_9BURK|nr:cyclase family protein [Trinickia terrae]TKC86385.1 cyclase family protein [Trinickia terrae]